MRLPKLSNKSQSFASGSKTSLQDKLTAKSWLFVTPTLQLGTYCSLLVRFQINTKKINRKYHKNDDLSLYD